MTPNHELWARINRCILDENVGEAVVTLMMGMCALLVHAGAASDEEHARVHVAAMLISPDPGKVGGLMAELELELQRLKAGLQS
jgi:hypothetical protein